MSDQKQRPTVTQAVLSALSKVSADGFCAQPRRPAPPESEVPEPEAPAAKPSPKQYLSDYLRQVINR